MTVYSWILIPALMIGFFCGTAAYYRTRQDRTLLARTILAFCLLTFALLMFYVVEVNPYLQPLSVTLLFFGLSLLLLITGISFLVFVPSAATGRLGFAEVHALLPESILELSPGEMRALLPARFQGYAMQEVQVLVMIELSRMAPEAIRKLTPETLKAALRRNVPHSILDPR